MQKLLVSVIALGVLAWACPAFGAGHSEWGCHSCHVPHHAGKATDANASWGVPLWSTEGTADGLPTFTIYTSKSFDALGTDIGQPDGASKLCLGCHDGSYDYFKIVKPTSSAILGTDLRTSHPVSFTYDSSLAGRTRIPGELRDPTVALSGLGGTIDQDLLDVKHKMQCSSCHDVHKTGKTLDLLRYDWDPIARTDANMCRVCHNK